MLEKKKNPSSKEKFIRQAHFQDLLQPHLLQPRLRTPRVIQCPTHENRLAPPVGRTLLNLFSPNVDTCMRMIQQHQETNGIPPTLEALGTSIWRSMVRKTSHLAAVTGSGAAEAAGGGSSGGWRCTGPGACQ